MMIKKILLYIFLLANFAILVWHITQEPGSNDQNKGKIPVLLNQDSIQVIKPKLQPLADNKNTNVADSPNKAENNKHPKNDLLATQDAIDHPVQKNEIEIQNDIQKKSIENQAGPEENKMGNNETASPKSPKKTAMGLQNDKINTVDPSSNRAFENKSNALEHHPIATSEDQHNASIDIQPPTEEHSGNEADKTSIPENVLSDVNPQSSKSTKEAKKPLETINSPLAAFDESCFSLKPLTQNQATGLSEFMKAQAIPHKEQHTTKVRTAGYLVMVQPATTFKRSKQNLRIVKKSGLDAFMITQGIWQKGISLGIFSTKKNAQTQMKRVQKKLANLKIKIEPRKREDRIYRVIIKLKKGQNLKNILQRSQIKQQKDKYIAEVAKKSCKSIVF